MYSYHWTETDSPKLKGEPDNSLFNRSEGHEVLYNVNKFLAKRKLSSIGSGNKAEKLLREKLASKIYTQVEVIAFLNKHW